jgi:hypothetical protein
VRPQGKLRSLGTLVLYPAFRALILMAFLSPPETCAQECPGDCDGDATVTVDELVIGVTIALGNQPSEACDPFDADGNGVVTVEEVVRAVANTLFGCEEHIDPTVTPTSGPSETPTSPERSATETSPSTPSPTSVPPECVEATVSPTYFYFPASGTAHVTVQATDDCCWQVQLVSRQPRPPCSSDAAGTLQEIRCGSSEVEISVYCQIGHLQDGGCWRIADRDVFVGCEHVTPVILPTRTPTPASAERAR